MTGLLTAREAEVCHLVCEDWPAKRIGASLHLSTATVEQYIAKSAAKLRRAYGATDLPQRAVIRHYYTFVALAAA